MTNIIKNCRELSDVDEQKALFYEFLDSENIHLSEKCKEIPGCSDSNIESEEVSEKYLNYGKFDNDYLDYISSLRDSNNEKRFSEIQHIFITCKNEIIQKTFALNIHRGVPLAITMENLTARLWFALNKGFGKNCDLKSFDIFYKSRAVYSRIVDKQMSKKIQDAKEMFEMKKFSEKQAISVIAEIKNSCNDLNNLTSEKIENIDKICSSSVNQIQEELSLKDLKNQSLQKEIEEKNAQIQELQDENKSKKEEFEKYEKFYNKNQKIKHCIKNVIGILICIVLLFFVIKFLIPFFRQEWPPIIGNLVSIISIIFPVVPFIIKIVSRINKKRKLK